MRNPLGKMHLRELLGDPGKYLTIFLLLVLSIAETSGFLVADTSMIEAYQESFERYAIEDGNFTVEKPLSSRQAEAVRSEGVRICELFYTDRVLTTGQTLRIFRNRDEADLACVMEGTLPEGPDEIALDRMYADNNDLSVGDTLTVSVPEKTYTVSGLVALGDYSALFENNNDMMFDASRFGVAVVSRSAFDAYDRDLLTFRYAWRYDDPPQEGREEREKADDFLQALSGIVSLKGFLPRFENQAITFTGNDMGGDRAMMMIFIYIVTIIIAFVFAVTISSTITKEAAVIGTLRATGYTRSELLRHYMVLPCAVTLAAAAVGNVLGYTVLKNVNADLYYGSYSLPTYVTRWNAAAFVDTTLVPLVLMIVVNGLIISRKLKLSPLQFLRRDLRKDRKRGVMRLPARIPFLARFRLRVLMQNAGNYLLLLAGILFASFLLLFGLMFPSVLKNYMDALPDSMLSRYQYVLQIPEGALREDRKTESLMAMLLFREGVETKNETAERFSAYVLHTPEGTGIKDEDIMLYGISEDSRYVPLSFTGEEVYVSGSYAERWGISAGDTITLHEQYDDGTYDFHVAGIYPYTGALCVFMDREVLNRTFDLGEGTFSGYFSDTPITDIDEKYVGQTIDLEALTKVSRQLEISMGSMMKVVSAFAVAMYVILMYILTKTVIEKNAGAISMIKILGYTNREIAGLYILVTTILVVTFMAVSIPLESILMKTVFRAAIRMRMSGWIPFILSNDVYIKMLVYGIVTYGLVAALEYRKIRKVPMDEALKNAE